MNLIREWFRDFFLFFVHFIWFVCWFCIPDIYLNAISIEIVLTAQCLFVYLFIYYVSLLILLLLFLFLYVYLSVCLSSSFLWRISVIWLNRFNIKFQMIIEWAEKQMLKFSTKTIYILISPDTVRAHTLILLNSLAIQVSAWCFAYAVFRVIYLCA